MIENKNEENNDGATEAEPTGDNNNDNNNNNNESNNDNNNNNNDNNNNNNNNSRGSGARKFVEARPIVKRQPPDERMLSRTTRMASMGDGLTHTLSSSLNRTQSISGDHPQPFNSPFISKPTLFTTNPPSYHTPLSSTCPNSLSSLFSSIGSFFYYYLLKLKY